MLTALLEYYTERRIDPRLKQHTVSFKSKQSCVEPLLPSPELTNICQAQGVANVGMVLVILGELVRKTAVVRAFSIFVLCHQ